MPTSFDEFMAPPYFPISVAELPGEMAFHAVTDTRFTIGDVVVTARSVPHCGLTNGYRIEHKGVVARLHLRSPAAPATARSR